MKYSHFCDRCRQTKITLLFFQGPVQPLEQLGGIRLCILMHHLLHFCYITSSYLLFLNCWLKKGFNVGHAPHWCSGNLSWGACVLQTCSACSFILSEIFTCFGSSITGAIIVLSEWDPKLNSMVIKGVQCECIWRSTTERGLTTKCAILRHSYFCCTFSGI